jgi:hypothetical protein
MEPKEDLTIKYVSNLGKMPLVNKFTNLHQNFRAVIHRHKSPRDIRLKPIIKNLRNSLIYLFLTCLNMSAEEMFGREACRKGVEHMTRNSNIPQQDLVRATP